ncbi:hypothetical protein A3K64_01855 [Candidatus Micrarchaeota archaeon RBG_16_36_9]|nr:MAG: hypothetical protein A3K64_01855 [Candidatus Micrarchaeota archaeon RBG_16_36_9]
MSFLIEAKSKEHGFERFRIHILKKQTINPESITAKYNTRPKRCLSGVYVGRKVSYEDAQDFTFRELTKNGYDVTRITLLL